jgi:hypothetical protein
VSAAVQPLRPDLGIDLDLTATADPLPRLELGLGAAAVRMRQLRRRLRLTDAEHAVLARTPSRACSAAAGR